MAPSASSARYIGIQIFQAKGHSYSTTALVGGDATPAALFQNGHFATLYLTRDYHRIHMPCDGTLTRMVHVPGDLFSVNPTTARGVPACLRATNGLSAPSTVPRDRLFWCWWAPPSWGMATVWRWSGEPAAPRHTAPVGLLRPNVELRQGDEMGRFLLAPPWSCCFLARAAVQSQSGCSAACPPGEAMAMRRTQAV